MQQINIHKVKLFALAEAAFALIGLFLTWTMEQYPAQQANQMGFGQMNAMTTTTQNGFNSWGYLALVGVIGVVASVFIMGDKTKDYDQNGKNLSMLSFVLIIAGALIYYFRLTSEAKNLAALYQQQYGINYSASAGMGIWLTLVAGVIGLAWVTGILNKLSAPSTPPPPPTPTI